jgi:hypothetical protein
MAAAMLATAANVALGAPLYWKAPLSGVPSGARTAVAAAAPNPDDPFTLGGDFNGDGRGDIARIVDYGPADVGIWVFMSDGVKFNVSSAYRGGPGGLARSKMLPFVGDVDGDGKDEVCAWYDYGAATTGLMVFDLSGSSFTMRETWRSEVGAWTWGNACTVAADIDGDGTDEVCAWYDYGQATTGLWVFDWTGSNFNGTRQWQSGTGGWTWACSKPVAADVDADGRDEIWTFYDYGSGNTGLFKWTSNGYAMTGAGPWMGQSTWAAGKPFAANLDGAPGDELGWLYDYGQADTAMWAFVWNGSTFDVYETWRSGSGEWDWARSNPTAVDADGDGLAEVFALYDDGSDGRTLHCWRWSEGWEPFSMWSKPAGDWTQATAPAVSASFRTPAKTSISIKASLTQVRIYSTSALSGAIAPGAVAGRNIVVYVQKPGSSRWTYSSNRTAYTLGAGAAWLYKYYFKRGMTKGLYKFKAVIADMPGFLGSASTAVGVRLR